MNNSLKNWSYFYNVSMKRRKMKKRTKGRFLSMLLGTLDANLIGNLLSGKRATATSQGQGLIRAGEGTIRAGQDF